MGLQKYGTGDGEVLLDETDAEPKGGFTREAAAAIVREDEPEEVAGEDG